MQIRKKMNMNKNVENTGNQITNTIEMLFSKGIVEYYYPYKYNLDRVGNIETLTWHNHTSGRATSSRAFTSAQQYLDILSGNSFHVMLIDYSIIRYSFVFNGNKLIKQNLLWWPRPVRIEHEADQSDLSIIDMVLMHLQDNDTTKHLNMRSPIRVDFYVKNKN